MPTKRIKLRAALNTYYAESATYSGYAEATRRAYRSTLEVLAQVCGSQMDAYALETAHFEQVLVKRRTPDENDNAMRRRVGVKVRAERGPSAIASDVKAFKSFIKFCHQREYLSHARNPVAHMRSNVSVRHRSAAKPIEEMVVQPTMEVFDSILEAAGKRHPRDRYVIALGFFAGLRQSEILSLKISGLDINKTVTKKGKRYRAPEIRVWRPKVKDWHRVPMTGRMVEETLRYLAWVDRTHRTLNPELYAIGTRRSGLEGVRKDGRFLPDTGPLRPDTPLDLTRPPASVVADVKAAFKAAGYEGLYRLGPHTCRRMGAIFVDQNADDPDAAQFFLGHQSRQTTEIYLQHQNKQDRLRRAMQSMGAIMEAEEPEEPEDLPSNVVELRPRRGVA